MIEPRDAARRQATWRVARIGIAAAMHTGLSCVVEQSPGSESVYLHTRRGGVWWGVRVSCHSPAHECCFDYQQLLLAKTSADGPLRRSERRIVAMVTRQGDVVADPAEVAAAIERLARALVDGQRSRAADGSRWRWSERDGVWLADAGISRRGAPPVYRPRAMLSPRVKCQVRHAANVSARWAWELGHAAELESSLRNALCEQEASETQQIGPAGFEPATL